MKEKNTATTATEMIEGRAIREISFSTSALKRSQTIESVELNNRETQNRTNKLSWINELTTLTSVMKFIKTIIIIDDINNVQVITAYLLPINFEEAAKKSFSG
ncbi:MULTISPECIES: hypothetical protein [Edwardsiella]|uniref:Uncharacterized protein n=2 Tax=Edwardsiella anguillarum TaxID=1821960 RepID=A0A076LP61_9GAMM|nr:MULTISPECIES: hypothetical protein [Edwardsiella]GAJ66571.1 flagellar hook-associated protein 3 [Edwardsiella piscicida]AIJ09666.1 Hypothetical protein ETEE_3241 [Edwardsiella anguillarum ET080813]UBU94952.1 hypothetical protein AAZ33_18870 [Edwardsiella sp. LADL05-105]UOU80445.1 hypothetical protein MUN71_07670 [Edwardsiella anguillarum]WHP85134.1 hypothetical protein MQ095_06830 [Edwardsiella anguillarum]